MTPPASTSPPASSPAPASASSPASASPQLVHRIAASRRRRLRRTWGITAVLAVLVVGVYVASLCIGSTVVPLADVARVLLGRGSGGAQYLVGELRLPRATLALAVGLANGAAGIVFQTLLRNQLASPDIIGISAGASAAGAVGIVILGWSHTAVSLLALVAALATAGCIYLLAYRGSFVGTRLILVGIGVGAMLHSLVTLVLSKASVWNIATLLRWLTGSLNNASWERVAPLAVCSLVVIPAMVLASRFITVTQLGDDLATSLGVNLHVTRIFFILAAVLLIAVSTAVCGPIAFVAFMSGPIAMRLVRSDNLIWPSALVGALIVLVADLVAQYAVGTKYPVGVVTGVLGAPFLIYLLVASQQEKL